MQDCLPYTPDLPGFIDNWNTKGWQNETCRIDVSGLPGSTTIGNTITLVK